MATREQVVAALFTRLKALVPGINFYARAFKDPNELQPEYQPALLLVTDSYSSITERGRPDVWKIDAAIIIYARALELDQSPETPLNAIVDLVESALGRQPNEPITDMTNPTDTNLGGLCSRVSINSIDIISGELGGQAAAMFRVEILCLPQED